MTMQLDERPTLEEIRTWPATVTVEVAASALGMSRAAAYRRAAEGNFPARVIRLGPRRIVVVTADLLKVLEAA
jgi:predicted DNA-binding transcriptional regulator AlpA